VRDKHSGFFVRSMSNEEKGFKTLTNEVNITKIILFITDAGTNRLERIFLTKFSG
jgi:hypothetical protein